MTKKRLTIAFLYALFLLCAAGIPTYDADAGPCSRNPGYCDRR